MNAIEDRWRERAMARVRRKKSPSSAASSSPMAARSPAKLKNGSFNSKKATNSQTSRRDKKVSSIEVCARFEPSCPTSRSSGWPMPSPKIAKFPRLCRSSPPTPLLTVGILGLAVALFDRREVG